MYVQVGFDKDDLYLSVYNPCIWTGREGGESTGGISPIFENVVPRRGPATLAPLPVGETKSFYEDDNERIEV